VSVYGEAAHGPCGGMRYTQVRISASGGFTGCVDGGACKRLWVMRVPNLGIVARNCFTALPSTSGCGYGCGCGCGCGCECGDSGTSIFALEPESGAPFVLLSNSTCILGSMVYESNSNQIRAGVQDRPSTVSEEHAGPCVRTARTAIDAKSP